MERNDGNSEGSPQPRSKSRILKSFTGWGCFRHENSARDEDDKAPRRVAGGRRHQQIMHVIETHFCPALVEWARDTAQWDQSEYSTARFVYENVLNLELVTKDVHIRTPESIEDLASAISPVFNASTTARIAATLTGFDAIVGTECTKGFIAQKFIWDWICYIIEQLFDSIEPLDDPSDLASSATTKIVSQGTEERPDAQGDASDVVSQTREVIQIHLGGASISDAWAANPVTAKLDECPEPDWTPEMAGNHFVYHGTSAHYNATWWVRYFTATPFDVLRAFTTANQMGFRAVPRLFTAFSPLRAFLWTIFKDNMACMAPSVIPSMAPSMAYLRRIQRPWFFNGAFYRGVVLSQFHDTQPSGLTHYTIPAGKEKAWGDISQGPAAHCTSLSSAWEQFNTIHGEGRGKWPNMIHDLEYGPELNRTDTSRTNMWRSMWKGEEGVYHLNSQHAATFAVNFELVGPNAPQQPASHKT
ncbi:hypothetical protein CMUS01_13787 [Colletotrichum musicola]|uniref:Uncharacterized protein n=1 Tax=Colletotrichum musicola TaxID=2175873 RepID=A0A8H6JAC7_9PEZI|nr:hypothetical protein CMUS01_13787 [Colletotrichum musicola]